MNYIFITYDAITEFASDRFFQSAEYNESSMLCNILQGNTPKWEHNKIVFKTAKNGSFFYTEKLNKKQGLIFDLSTFKGFTLNDKERIITIFQKTIKYAVRYFEMMPIATCEKLLPGTTTTIVYPFPFAATKDVDKVMIDRNSSKQDRKERNFLTVFFFGNNDKVKVSFTNLNKAIGELEYITYSTNLLNRPQQKSSTALVVTDLNSLNLSIDAKIGYDNWQYYLTENQRKFVTSPIIGPERLEGAAGTGKTLSMILKCIYLLKEKIKLAEEYHIIFITHSLATKERIIDIFQNNWSEFRDYQEKDGSRPFVSIFVTTLQEWSANHLGTNSIAEDEYLDKDASYSKAMQILYIEQSFDLVMKDHWNAYKVICSDKFSNFLTNTPKENLLEMMQQEIAVLIKGRAGGIIDKYKILNRPKYSMPIKNEADQSFMFMIFKNYQQSLEKVGQYDSDDIILSALGQINTPIWNRRRSKEGYDVCFIDETHLFNINELSIFHYINKPSPKNNIIFAIDKSQAIGDWGITNQSLGNAFGVSFSEEENHKFGTVFRSSPDIVNLAFNILSSGATLFTNFENPLDYSSFNFTKEDERKCERPIYTMYCNDDTMIEKAFNWADDYCKEKGCFKSNVLLIATTDLLLKQMEMYTKNSHKAFEVLKSRSDSKTIKQATEGNKYLLSGIDYVGGLEFEAVVIVGVDEGRVPPSRSTNEDSYYFMNYAWHNRMYVAVTRAKYAICLLGVQSRGRSPILESSIYNEILDYVEK